MKKLFLLTLTLLVLSITISGLIPLIQAAEQVGNTYQQVISKTTSDSRIETIVKNLWVNLNKTENQCHDLYDYFPESGILTFYCHIKTFIDYAQLQRLAGMKVFLSGPHTRDNLVLDSSEDFGHYNVEFVTWLRKNLIPATHSPAFRRLTQPIYEHYVKSLARTYYMVHKQLLANPNYLAAEKQTYSLLLQQNQLPKDYGTDYFYFANLYQEGFNGNIVDSSVLFWIRRIIDGSEKEFFAALKTLLETYDAGFITENIAIPAKNLEIDESQTMTDVLGESSTVNNNLAQIAQLDNEEDESDDSSENNEDDESDDSPDDSSEQDDDSSQADSQESEDDESDDSSDDSSEQEDDSSDENDDSSEADAEDNEDNDSSADQEDEDSSSDEGDDESDDSSDDSDSEQSDEDDSSDDSPSDSDELEEDEETETDSTIKVNDRQQVTENALGEEATNNNSTLDIATNEQNSDSSKPVENAGETENLNSPDQEQVLVSTPDTPIGTEGAINFDQVARQADQKCQANRVLLSDNWTLYSSLNEALQAASHYEQPDYHYIWLCPGKYYETVTLEGRNRIYIHGEDASLITGKDEVIFTIKNSDDIVVEGLHLVHQTGEMCSQSCFELNESSNIVLRNNDIEGSGYHGIATFSLKKAAFIENKIHSCQYGFYAYESTNLMLKDNVFSGNVREDVSFYPEKGDATWNDWQMQNTFISKTEGNPEDTNSQTVHIPVDEVNLDDISLRETYENSASKGDTDARLALAFYWYKKSAEQGNTDAQVALGDLYREAEDEDRPYADNKKAVDWYRIAAEQGSASGQVNLGWMYEQGHGIAQDKQQALYWYRLSAEQGDDEGQYLLGRLYQEGVK